MVLTIEELNEIVKLLDRYVPSGECFNVRSKIMQILGEK